METTPDTATEFDLLMYLNTPTAYVMLASSPDVGTQNDASLAAMQSLSELLQKISTESSMTRTEYILRTTNNDLDQRRRLFEILLQSMSGTLEKRRNEGNRRVINSNLGEFVRNLFRVTKAAEENRRRIRDASGSLLEMFQGLAATTAAMSGESNQKKRTGMQTAIRAQLEAAGQLYSSFIDLTEAQVLTDALVKEGRVYGF